MRHLLMALIDRPVLNTILAVALPFALTCIFALYMRRSNRKHEAAMKEIETKATDEREASKQKHDEEKERLREGVTAQKELLNRLGQIENLYASLRGEMTQAQPIYAALLEKAIGVLTHPSKEFFKDDKVLAKVLDGTLTEEERTEKLEPLLLKRAIDPNPEVSEEEKLIAGILPTLMLLADAESKSIEPFTNVKLISGTAPEPGKAEEEKKSEELKDI